MDTIRVNADYELELFTGKGSTLMNESLEFLAFFTDERPVLTNKKYSSEYLNHVASYIGHEPRRVSSGRYENWWGSLQDLEKERWLNSKITSTDFCLEQGLRPEAYVLKSSQDLNSIKWDRHFILKDPFAMSGKGFRQMAGASDYSIKDFPQILEPLLNRTHDFSHYFFSDDRGVCYENFVDEHFQYRGTLFRNYLQPSVENLSFYSLMQKEQWDQFKESLEAIRSYYRAHTNKGFSVDSFIFRDGDFQIRPVSEVNVRRTMGSVTYELARRFAQDRPWCLFLMGRLSRRMSFAEIKKNISSLENVILLSPDDVRYQMFFLSARDEFSGKELLRALKDSLPDCQLPINI